MTDRIASDVISSLDPTPPPGRASDIFDPDKMKREAEKLAREQQRSIDAANANGGPKLR